MNDVRTPEYKKAEKKPIHWMGSCLKDLSAMPEDIQDVIGKALLRAQYGGQAANAETLHGFHGASVLAVKEDHDDNCTYRLVYTVKYPRIVYALHAFKKKSHQGSQTPKKDKEAIATRLQAAERHYQELASRNREPAGYVQPKQIGKKKNERNTR